MVVESWAIPAAALVISMGGVVFTWLAIRHTATTAYTEQLERRIEHLEREHEKAMTLIATTTAENRSLRDENLDLLQRLFHATGGRRSMPEDGR